MVYACVCPYMHMNGEEKVNMECHWLSFFTFSFETGLSLNPEFTDWLAWLARETQGFTCLTPILSTRVTLMTILGFYVVSENSQLRSLSEHAMHSNGQSHLPNVPCFYYYMTNCEYTNYFWFMMKLDSCLNLCDFELQTKLVSFPEESILLKKNTWQVWSNLRYIQMGTGQTFSPVKNSP